jgi:hypothetical protein
MKKLIALLFFPCLCNAQIKINDLPAALDLTGAFIPVTQGGVTKKAAATLFGGSTYTANSPTTVSVGGLSAGTPIAGLSIQTIIERIVAPFVAPVFTSFSVSSPSLVEVGSTLSGPQTFIWSINQNSGVVPSIDIKDVTTGLTLLAATPNDGNQVITIPSVQLTAANATQRWQGVGNNTSPTASTFNSPIYTTTAVFKRFFGPSTLSATTSAQIRALPISQFHTGASTFSLNTGSTAVKFIVALPPSVTISSVIDIDASNANLTSAYVLIGNTNVIDAGGTNRSYNIYELNLGSPYSSSHQHNITTAN